MRVTTANIKCNPQMRQAFVDSDIRHVRNIPGIIMGQEIEIPRYKVAWQRLMRGKGKTTRGIAQECPISIPTKNWTLIGDVEIRLMHHGKKHTSPNRYVTVQKAQRKSDGLKVAFMNTHMVSGAFTSKFKLNKAWRKQRWWEHWRAMVKWIAELISEGWTVILGGDFNKTNLPDIYGQIELAHHGLDHLLLIPADGIVVGHVQVSSLTAKNGMHTDHPILSARFPITRHRL